VLPALKPSKLATPPIRDPATARLRVLVVDDDAYMRVLCSLEFPELDLLEATGVQDGLRLAEDERPDVVVIDVHLAGRDGLDLLRLLRDHGPTSQIPAVVITAGHDEGQRAKVIGAGADEYLRKPLDSDEFRERLVDLMAMTPVDRWARRVEMLSHLLVNDDVIDLRESRQGTVH
jgi:DNA-binding response OmpR family regulator